ncbi:hypothetical protein ILUMI_23723 [Ignelater luminosus]|uniref:Uncharacterized protein n=1 Tax=Ignelater luminosus TaxID=2038154 RepID=A0A8K0CBJ4_IGNLU|nr:hypothetical protein ILUMI_23723 [Ignelater luminosus]
MCQENQGYALQLPSTSKAVGMHSYSAPLPLPKSHAVWTEDNSLVEEQGKFTVSEDIENYIPTVMPSGANNEYNTINCNPIHVSTSTHWPAICPSAIKNEVTIIRPTTMQNNDDVSNTFVTYDYSAS